MKRFIVISLACIFTLVSVGCSAESLTSFGDKTVNLDDGTEQSVPGYDENNIDAQIATAQEEREAAIAENYRDLTDKELTELADTILAFHSTNSTSNIVEEVQRYEEFRSNMKLYTYNIIKRSDCEALITEMQDNLRLSRFKRHDNDSDGISDYYEMMVSNTSPLLNKTNSDKLDAQEKYSLAYIVYISSDGEAKTIEPEFAPTFYEAIKAGNIRPLDNQYMVLNLRAYGRELDSLRLVTTNFEEEYDAAIALSNNTGSYENQAEGIIWTALADSDVVTATFPVAFKITGSISTQLAGSVDIEHIDYTSVTNEPSIFLTYTGTLLETTNIIDYLARTPSSTSLPPDDSIMTDTTYMLVFPQSKTFVNGVDSLRTALYAAIEILNSGKNTENAAVNYRDYFG